MLDAVPACLVFCQSEVVLLRGEGRIPEVNFHRSSRYLLDCPLSSRQHAGLIRTPYTMECWCVPADVSKKKKQKLECLLDGAPPWNRDTAIAYAPFLAGKESECTANLQVAAATASAAVLKHAISDFHDMRIPRQITYPYTHF
jgi:hypothetical protein